MYFPLETKMYAWAWETPRDLRRDPVAMRAWFDERLAPFGGRMGLVFYPFLFDYLEVTPHRIAYVTRLRHAEDLVARGVSVDAVIVQDEVNITGLSGHRKTPEEYRQVYMPIYELLKENDYTVSTAGMAYQLPNWWQSTFHRSQFDDDYHQQLPPADVRAANPHLGGEAEIRDVIDTYPGQWIVSPHPYNPVWSPLRDNTIGAYVGEQLFGVDTFDWVRISQHPNILGVALWCLQEGKYFDTGDGENRWQSWHGIWDRNGKLTVVGKELLKGLRTYGSTFQ